MRLIPITIWRKTKNFVYQHRLIAKVVCFAAIAVLLVELVPGLYNAWWNRPANYQLNSVASAIVGEPVKVFADKLQYNGQTQAYEYNKDYKPNPGTESTGMISGPRFGAKFEAEGQQPYTITDIINNVGITFTPQFDLARPEQDGNRLVYPVRGLDAQKVISLKAAIVKEDMIINSYQKDELEFKYKLDLPDGLEARTQNDGSIGIYGVDSSLLGNVSTGGEADAKLLEKARQNGEKNQLLFTIPTPFVVDAGKKLSDAKAEFELDDDQLTLKASQLSKAKYPISIDPSVYIETAAKLMKGNNETNIDFDITNELIQKSQTTGARIDEWTATTDLNTAIWDNSVAAAGGHLYSVGGWEHSTVADTPTYVRANSTAGSLSTTLDIGSADTNRLVAVFASSEAQSSTALSGVTVDSKACTIVQAAYNTDGLGNRTEMWYCDEDNLGSSNGTV